MNEIIEELNFVNTAVNTLPLDPIRKNYPRNVPACYSLVTTTPIVNPKMVALSIEALQLLDINQSKILSENFVNYFCGNMLLPGSVPAAHCYCGHQFGYFSGQLGDGRAHYLGEIYNKKGERYELQLKGSGKTPYSRKGDGRAVLRSSIREFLCSEAMYYLRVPTTRAATIITSDTYVDRDVKYNGDLKQERATVISRIAPTFIRFGSFQICDKYDPITGASGPALNQPNIVIQLLNYIVRYHYPHIFSKYLSIEDRALALCTEIVARTAKMVAQWQSYGFTHGVLNTDNMSIIGLTIDYGPFGFMDVYDPNYVPNTSDKEGRYKFIDQPSICKWNLEILFKSISSVIPNIKQKLDPILGKFDGQYSEYYLDIMRSKLGFLSKFNEDEQIIKSLLDTMYTTSGDYTNILRNLSSFDFLKSVELQPILSKILKQTNLKTQNKGGQVMCDVSCKDLWLNWFDLYKERIMKEAITIKNGMDRYISVRTQIMDNNNPKYILRNHLIQKAIDKANEGDYSEVIKLLDVLRDPFDKLKKYDNMGYDVPPLDGMQQVLSCSS